MRRQVRHSYSSTLLIAAALAGAAIGAQSSAFAQTFTVTPPSPGCQLLSAPASTTPAFCDTFDKPEGIGDRSGALNGTVWGVSRMLGGINQGQGQFFDVSPTAIQLCGTTYSVITPNDVQICDGQLVEAQFDQTGVTSLAMYPKQPFDISGGRTGTIAFDVSNDSHGTHSVWPELWYVDTPVPTPFVHDTSLISVPANGFGVRFALTCPANSGGCGARGFCPEYSQSVPVVTVDAAWVIHNYMETEVDAFSNPAPPPGTLTVTPVDCVQASSGPGNMNHYELRVSQNEIDVYGIDAGATGPLKEIAKITNAGLTLTAGLLFMEDNHYNANKDSNGQGVHTFTWDNFAFDGPILPRDLAFDVLDRLTPVGPGYPGLLNDGWGFGGFDQSPAPPPLTLTVPGVYNVANAVAALLTFNFQDFNYANLSAPVPFISYSVNNGATQLAPFPFGPCGVQNGGPACSSEYTISVPVNLSDVVAGDNTITLTATDGVAISNVDLILHAAGGIPCTISCPAPLPSPTVTITPSASSITNAQGLTVAVNVAGSGTSVPVPTGTVTLSEVGYTSSPVTLSGGHATISIPAGSLPAGPDLLTVNYSGDSNYSFTSNNSSVNVSSAQPVAGNVSLIFSPSAYPSITTAQPLQFVVDLFGSGFLAPIVVTGNVTVTGGGYNSGAVHLAAGLATINIPAGALAVGNDTFAVNYSGDSNYAAADFTDQITITVTGTSLPTITSFVASPATITAGSSGTLTGVFSNGTGVITPGNISVTSGKQVSVSPTATTTYTLTVTPTTGTAVTKTATVIVEPATTPALTSPTPGSVLGTTNVVFSWKSGTGVTEYDLYLGTTGVGSDNLYNSAGVTTTSVTVPKLPSLGAKVYARLYYLISGVWQSSDYTYTESPIATPVLTSPTPGSVLGTSNVVFSWTPGGGVAEYDLYLGTTAAGSTNLYNSAGVTTTSVTVAKIPSLGATVYVRLSYLIKGVWGHTDYTYAESPIANPVLTSPLPGSVLGTTNVAFSWTPGGGVTEYDLYLGTTGAGSDNLYNSAGVTTTSVTVPTLPSKGVTVYARLFYRIKGVWQSADYTYTER
jgi:hypothetical protein